MKTFFKRFVNDKSWRKRQLRYWFQDPFWGGLDFVSHYCLRYLPIRVNAKIGAFLGVVAAKYRFKTEDQRARHNLAVLRPDLSEKERDKLRLKMWQNIGQSMSEYSVLDKVYLKNRVTLENKHYLQPFIDNRKPVIFVFAHTGNWEIYGNYVIAYGFDLLGVIKPVRNRFASKIAAIARARMGETIKSGGVIKLIEPGHNSMRTICKHLADKGALWIALDEFKNSQVHGPRLGRQLQLQNSNAAYAARLAQRFNATLIPILNRRNEGSRYTIKIGKPITVPAGENAIAEALLELDQMLEAWVMDNLDQWYMLHELRL